MKEAENEVFPKINGFYLENLCKNKMVNHNTYKYLTGKIIAEFAAYCLEVRNINRIYFFLKQKQI